MVFLAMAATGCKKYLDEKSQDLLVIISTLTDCQALMDLTTNVNNKDVNGGDASADNYYLNDADLASLTAPGRNMYTWQPYFVYADNSSLHDWGYAYHIVYLANTVLENLEKIERTSANAVTWDDIKGQALFLRGKSFLQLLGLFANAYDPSTSGTDLGIVLRFTTRLDEKFVRSSVKDSYDQVLADMEAAARLLPKNPVHVLRPSKPAAYSFAARAFLYMGQYDSCSYYTQKALQIKSMLRDFNTMNTAANFTFAPQYTHPEIIYSSVMPTHELMNITRAKVDSNLYALYVDGDLRKKIFFRGNAAPYVFKGSFSGNQLLWSGTAVNELVLMKAECAARRGDKDQALDDLNYLLKNRYDDDIFIPVDATDGPAALRLILTERRKEFPFSGLRWMDIKRLNKEGANIVLTRKVNGQFISLPPNDPRYALAIPLNVIEFSNIPQNPR
ncbi:MAG: RagB/SusD family nutrient uptake outer membrane protein [Pseudobacter sp.]|uniref:RagB/SusD family nutrient uptake outer membrane protein n=1 Tax=Pseudobacter sp. TaxID=2045420 RepID=UPI003F821764